MLFCRLDFQPLFDGYHLLFDVSRYLLTREWETRRLDVYIGAELPSSCYVNGIASHTRVAADERIVAALPDNFSALLARMNFRLFALFWGVLRRLF